jgi:preprotein translocase subunit SecG
MLYTIFGFLAIVSAILLTLIVVVQNSKGGGLSSTFGASNLTSMIGTRRVTQDIEKFTWYLLAALFILAFLANVTNAGKAAVEQASLGTIMEAPAAPAVAPSVPTPQPVPVGDGPQ